MAQDLAADDANAALDTTEPKETQKTETTAVTTTTDDADDQGGLDDDDAGEEIVLKSGGQEQKTFKVKRKDVQLANLVVTMISGDKTTKEVECPQVPADTLKRICEYLEHHGGKAPEPLPCPVRSVDMKQICSDEFDATFIDNLNKKEIFEIILAANYLDIPSLLHLGCAKIATLIKQLDQKEINKIIEEEERYRREHAQNTDANKDADNQDEYKE